MVHEERNTDEAGGNTTIGRQKTQQKVRGRENIVSFCIDGRKRKAYRDSQSVRRWTEECCRYLDHLATIDVSFDATWRERSRYENMLVLELNSMMGSIKEICQIEMIFH